MAAEVDFGDLELFEAFDPQEESTLKPVHTRFKDEDSGEEKANGVGDAELRERLRQCEETIEHLRAENILPARWARHRRGVRGRARRKFHEAGIPSGFPGGGSGIGVRAAPRAPCKPLPPGDPELPPVFRVPLDCSLLPWSPHWAPSLVIVVTGFRFGGIRGCRAGS